MKKICLTLLLCIVISHFSFAQWTTVGSNTTTTNSVGIGTTSPAFKLDVNGSVNGLASSFTSLNINNTTTLAPLVVSSPGTSTGIEVATDGTTTSLLSYDRTYGLYKTFTQRASEFFFYPSDNAGQKMTLDGTGNLSVTGIGNSSFAGKLGIATTNPLSLLQVDDGCTKASIGDASGSVLNYGTSYLGFNASRTGSGWVLNADTVHNGGGVIYSGIAGDMYFAAIPSTSSSSQTISDATLVSKIALHIAPTGIVYAKQIVTQPSIFPDYVFKKDYPLMSLNELQGYINKNHHLPEIPSAADVEKNGLNLGEINKTLVKKVEELTLYMIEKDKQVHELQKQNTETKDQLKEMKLQIEALTKKVNN